MILFKELFENTKNMYLLESEMNNSAIPYYNEVLTQGIKDMEECKYFLLILDKLYQKGFISPLRDDEYDEVLDIFLDNGGEMIRGDLSSGDKAVHVYPNLKGTIKKVHYITEESRLKESRVSNHKSLESWLKIVFKECEEAHINIKELKIGLYAKYDGLSVVLEIDKGKVKSAITRGDKELGTGQDKTKVLSLYSYENECELLNCDKFGLKCEALVSKKGFAEYNSLFGNDSLIDPRSAATSILNSDAPTLDELKYLCLMPLMLCKDGKEYPIPNEEITVFNEYTGFHKELTFDTKIRSFKSILDEIEDNVKKLKSDIDKDCEYPVDGIVIRIENKDVIKFLGRNEQDCINNWERAYKFKPECKKTRLIKVEQEIGLLGKVSFIAKVEPVKMKNRTIKSISLGSEARFNSLNLSNGDEVLVQYDIIPYLTVDNTCEKSGNESIKVITHCPYCGEELVRDPELRCVNLNCKSRVMGRIYNYCSKMNIVGIGKETIQTLFNNGLLDKISDLYTLKNKKKEMENINRFGNKMIKNLIESIESIKSVSSSVLLGSLGIPSCGVRVFDKILKKIPFEELIEIKSPDDLKGIEGIGGKMREKVFQGLTDFKSDIYEIISHVNIKKSFKPKMTVCFSKIRNKEFEQFLAKQQVETVDNLSKNVDLLIVGPGHSSKIDKANKLGIPVMSISDAYLSFGYVEK